MNIEEQIKELDAIINLYKDEPYDGLRNKIWAWHTKKLTQRIEQTIKAIKIGYGSVYYHFNVPQQTAINEYIDEIFIKLSQQREKGKEE